MKPSQKENLLTLGMCLSVLFSIFTAILFSNIIDVIIARKTHFVYAILLYGSGSLLCILLSILLENYLPLRYQLFCSLENSAKALQAILKLPFKNYTKHDKGYYQNIAMNSAFTKADVEVQSTVMLRGYALCVVLILLFIFHLHFMFGMLFLFYIPLDYLLIKKPSLFVANYQKQGLTKQDHFLSEIKTIVENKTLINQNKADSVFIHHFNAIKKDYLDFICRFKLYTILAEKSFQLLASFLQVMVLLIAGYFLSINQLSVGNIIFLYQMTQLYQHPLNRCFEIWTHRSVNHIHIKRMLDLERDGQESSDFQLIYDQKCFIDIQKASFQIENQFLFDIDELQISHPYGLWLVHGANGTGKSTFFHYLLGFSHIDWAKGHIKVSSHFQKAAILTYPILLITGSLQDNLFGHQPKEELYSVLNIDFQTKQINAIHINLSYGQQQKLALLRILSSPSSILILDEPFTNLDEDTCHKLAHYLIQSSNSKAIFVIDHTGKLDSYADC